MTSQGDHDLDETDGLSEGGVSRRTQRDVRRGGPIDAALRIGHLEIAIGIMSIGELCIAGEKLGVVEYYVL